MKDKLLDVLEDNHIPFITANIFGKTVIGFRSFCTVQKHKVEKAIPGIDWYYAGSGKDGNGHYLVYYAF